MADAPEPAQPAQGAQSALLTDPYQTHNFKLEVPGMQDTHFTSCSNIGIRVQALTYREAGISQVVRQLPGRVEYAAITLRYALTSSTELWDWFMTVVSGTVERKNVSIVLLESDGVTEGTRWNLEAAWPCEWNASPLDAVEGGVAIESLKLVCETLTRD